MQQQNANQQQNLLEQQQYQRTMYSSTPSKSLTTTTSGAYSLESQPYSLNNQQQLPIQQQQQQQFYAQQSNSCPLTLSERDDLQHKISSLNLENEVLRTELYELAQENDRLNKEIRVKDMIQTQMSEQLKIVTKTANALYMKIRDFKCRYYEQQKPSAWSLSGGTTTSSGGGGGAFANSDGT